MPGRYSQYLVDTNIVTKLRNREPKVVEKWSSVHDEDIFVSIITVGEIVRGRMLVAEDHNKNEPRVQDTYSSLYEQFTEDLRELQILDYRQSALKIFHQLPNTVKLSDKRIAAIALDYGLILVTHDGADFPRLNRDDLVTEDWARDDEAERAENWVPGEVYDIE